MTDVSDLYQELGSAVLTDPSVEWNQWTKAALVFSIDAEGNHAIRGYLFSDLEWQGFLPETHIDAINTLLLQIREVIADGTTGLWASALIQFNLVEIDMMVNFDYDDPDRWRVTPTNIDEMIEEIRTIE